MRWYMYRGCPIIIVSFFCLFGLEAGGADAPADKESLRYDGKSFEYWRIYLRTELKAERRIDAIRALAAFGARGHAQSAVSAIVDAVKDYGENAYDGDADHLSLDQKVIEAAKEAIDKIGPVGFEIVLRNVKDANICLFAAELYSHPFKRRRENFLSPTAVRTLLDYVQGGDTGTAGFAVEMLGHAIDHNPASKANTVAVLRAEKDTARLVRALIKLLSAEDWEYIGTVLESLGPRAKAATAAMIEARLQGKNLSDGNFQAIGVEAKELMPNIIEGLKSQESEVRRRAAGWLAEIGVKAEPALPVLLQGLNEGPKKKAANAESRVEYAETTYSSAKERLRRESSTSMGIRGATYAPSPDEKYQPSDEEEDAWLAELGALRRLGTDPGKLMPSLVHVVADRARTCGCRITVADALGEMGPSARDALPALREAAKAPEAPLRKAAAAAIAKIEAKEQK